MNSQPAFPLEAPAPEARARPHGEDYWRREVERVERRLEPLRRRADHIRVRIEERRRKPRVRPYSDPQIESWEREVRAIEERIREYQLRLEERARREGALPGWLRQ